MKIHQEKIGRHRMFMSFLLLMMVLFLFALYLLLPYWEIKRLSPLPGTQVHLTHLFLRGVVLFLTLYILSLVNFHYLIERFFLKQRYFIYGLSLILLTNLVLAINQAMLPSPSLDLLIQPTVPLTKQESVIYLEPTQRLDDLSRFDPTTLFMILIVLGLSSALAMSKKYFDEQIVAKESERDLLQAELINVRNQIEPHFFFNALNNIHSMIGRDAALAKDSVYRFSKIMRHVLINSQRQTNVESEIELLKHYIAFQRQCFDCPVRVEFAINVLVPHVTVPAMTFLPLVENAFKYGVHPTKASFVEIDLDVTEKQVFFRVKNSNHSPCHVEHVESSGIGQQNVEKKLMLMYGNLAQVRKDVGADEYCVTITIENGHEKY